MITRRRGRTASSPGVRPSEVDAAETDQELPGRPERVPADDVSVAGLEVEALFGMEDLKWTLDRDASSPFFDLDLADLDVCSAKEQDSGFDASVASSPDRMSSDLQLQNRKLQSSHTINKNAIAAKLNRLKKKEYVTSLERKVGVLATESSKLKQENTQLTQRVEELEDETRYLRAVLANESMLAQLLSRLSGMNGMKLSSSLFQGFDSNDHDYALPRKRVKVEDKDTSGGVCLHVDKNHVSVEFCTKCAESASTALKIFF
ncbi:CREB/ATF bZIP transcription factor [Brachionichthys hirsutus]|uniref:CREB/ATF bZIP transcription factor n=1 Tax=Brachionichthys hirsutus TaxID=412623 RepID=UPI00360508EA